jgi:hypothetical protein
MGLPPDYLDARVEPRPDVRVPVPHYVFDGVSMVTDVVG